MAIKVSYRKLFFLQMHCRSTAPKYRTTLFIGVGKLTTEAASSEYETSGQLIA